MMEAGLRSPFSKNPQCPLDGTPVGGASFCPVADDDRNSRSVVRRRTPKLKPYDPWLDLEWEEDAVAQKLTREHVDGMTLEDVGAHMGLTRERVRQIEVQAIRKLSRAEGNGMVELDGYRFAVLECADCSAEFVRLSGRQEFCETCSAEKRRTATKGRERVHAWHPTARDDSKRRRLTRLRLAESRGLEVVSSEPQQVTPIETCAGTVIDGSPCTRVAKHVHDDKPYCGVHHPPSADARSAKRRATFERKRQRRADAALERALASIPHRRRR